MDKIPLLWLPLALLGCADASHVRQQTVDTPGLEAVQSLVERGDLTYVGAGNGERVQLDLEAWGLGMGGGMAESRAEKVAWTVDYADGLLISDVLTPARKSGGDLTLAGPRLVHLDLIAAEGDVELSGVDGDHIVTAHAVRGGGISGQVDLFAANGGIDVGFAPAPGTESALESHHGDITLRLPPGGDYTVEVFIDPSYGALVDVPDLVVEEHVRDRLLAVSGTGDAWISVAIVGGAVWIEAADPGAWGE